MAVNSNLRGNAFNLLPTGVAQRDLGYSFLVDIHISDLNAVSSLDREAVAGTHIGQVILSICTKLQNKD
ncbi:hypothetical protein A6R68_09523 [Neotoma lepida]|uniref:Uncharacterized protein n=1 Tax=Neotoma lepida TaxID=56216 RepID=A0A1A6G1T6_NEOLE|nr:hypothetical protein A6R68_09523 [Neotoma lepida]